MADLTIEEKLALIKQDLAEVLNEEIIVDVLKSGRDLRIYWGTATTGRPHTGYIVPALAIARFLVAGCHVTILLADIHAKLDNLKSSRELVKYRVEYYQFLIVSLLKAVGVPIEKLHFVVGSTFQRSEAYVDDLYDLLALVSERNAKKAGAEVVKQSDNMPAGAIVYPLLQVLDEQHLDVDCQFGGVDQRKLFTAAKEWLPKLGYKERAHLMNPMVPGLQGGKMSSSDPDSKIDLLDPPDVVTRKLRKAHAAPREDEDNGIISFIEFVLIPASKLKHGKAEFRVERERDGLEPLVYDNIAKVREDYRADLLTPQLIKAAATKALNELLAPIQAEYSASPRWQEINEKAYPPEPKKAKKVKTMGTRYPGAQKTESTPDVKGAEKAVEALTVAGDKAEAS